MSYMYYYMNKIACERNANEIVQLNGDSSYRYYNVI